MAGKKSTASPEGAEAAPQGASERKRWVKLTPRDHVLKQIEIQRELVESLRTQLESLRTQLQKEEQTLQGMEKAKEFFPN